MDKSKDSTYRGYEIKDCGYGYFEYCHKEYDLDGRIGTASSTEEAKVAIDEWEADHA